MMARLNQPASIKKTKTTQRKEKIRFEKNNHEIFIHPIIRTTIPQSAIVWSYVFYSCSSTQFYFKQGSKKCRRRRSYKSEGMPEMRNGSAAGRAGGGRQRTLRSTPSASVALRSQEPRGEAREVPLDGLRQREVPARLQMPADRRLLLPAEINRKCFSKFCKCFVVYRTVAHKNVSECYEILGKIHTEY